MLLQRQLDSSKRRRRAAASSARQTPEQSCNASIRCGRLDDLLHVGNDVRMLLSEIVLFTNVAGQIIQLNRFVFYRRSLLSNALCELLSADRSSRTSTHGSLAVWPSKVGR